MLEKESKVIFNIIYYKFLDHHCALYSNENVLGNYAIVSPGMATSTRSIYSKHMSQLTFQYILAFLVTFLSYCYVSSLKAISEVRKISKGNFM